MFIYRNIIANKVANNGAVNERDATSAKGDALRA